MLLPSLFSRSRAAFLASLRSGAVPRPFAQQPVRRMECAQEQEDELLALEAIFAEDFNELESVFRGEEYRRCLEVQVRCEVTPASLERSS